MLTTQEKLERIKNYHTRYEVLVTDTAGEYRSCLVGYTSRKSFQGLLAIARQNGPKLIALLGISENDSYQRDGKQLRLGRWMIYFSGRTQREAYLSHERPFIGQMESMELVS